MAEGLRARGKAWVLDGAALLIGLVLAMGLVSLYEYVEYTLSFSGPYREEDAFLTRAFMVSMAAFYAAIYGSLAILVCVPIWLLLRRCSLATAYSAAALGALGGVVAWYTVETHASSLWWMTRAAVYAATGAAAGLAVWFSRRRLQPHDSHHS